MKNTTHSNSVASGAPVGEEVQHRNPRQFRFMHDEPRARREYGFRVDQCQQLRDALIGAAGERQKPHRFRQLQRQDRRQQQRRHAADDEHRAPAECGIMRRRQQAAERCADREAAEHDHHHGGAAAARIEFGRQRDGIRHRAAKTEAGQKADRQQRVDVLDEGGDQRADAERERRENDDLLAPDAVRQRSEHQRADHQPEQPRGEHRAERAPGQAPFLGQRRRDKADRLGVEAVEKQHRRAGQQQPDLKSADRLLIDELGDIDGRSRRLWASEIAIMYSP